METDYPQGDRGSLIAFVHIPKTAGTTLNSILAQQYSPDELHEVMMRGMSWIAPQARLVPKPLISLSKIHRLKAALRCPRRLRLIHGHFDLSLLRVFPAGARCFTLLRDPVDRAISHYYHYRRMTADPVHALAMRSTLAQWVSACGLVEMDNGQTRRLAGEMNLPCGRVNAGMLERAKSNLARFAVVGLTERFEESLVLLQRAFRWELRGFQAHNVGKNRPPRAEVGEDALRAMEDSNRFDLELYRFACGLFEKAVAGIDMDAELVRLRGAADASRAASTETQQLN
ncbi:MAG TPA: sulfotransferase domain-containing protein [Burkholderiales bacterium]|nr:sulfotransferase domain-containing protein [Burkholderiales bacterium]